MFPLVSVKGGKDPRRMQVSVPQLFTAFLIRLQCLVIKKYTVIGGQKTREDWIGGLDNQTGRQLKDKGPG